jgi:hypothetical protein
MISMTYARTLAHSGEFLWFEGAEKVQGFTNMLWTLYMALLHYLGFAGSNAALAVSISGAVLISLIAIVTRALILGGSKEKRHIFLANIGVVSVYFLFPLTFWTLRGMEVGLLALLYISIVYFLQAELRQVNRFTFRFWLVLLLVSAGVATRIDFIVPISALVLCLVLYKVQPSKGVARTTLTKALVVFLAGALSLIGVIAFQMWVWGDLLPNTYFLKVEGYALPDRIMRGVVSAIKFLPLSMLAAISWWQIEKNSSEDTRQLSTLLLSGIFASLAYSVYVGGDAWEGLQMANRYLALALVPVLIVCLLVVRDVDFKLQTPHFRRRFLLITGLSTILLGASVNPIAFKPIYTLAGALSLGGILVLFFLLNKYKLIDKGPRNAQGVAAILLVLTFSSAIPISSMLAWGTVQAAGVDAQMTSLGLALKEATKPGARIAFAWAGAPVYYSERQAIDLLGKNDKRIARQNPVFREGTWNAEFYPGHNKFDFDYSIGILKPAIMAQLLGVSEEVSKLASLGYERKCLAGAFEVYVLKGSPHLKLDKFVDCD